METGYHHLLLVSSNVFVFVFQVKTQSSFVTNHCFLQIFLFYRLNSIIICYNQPLFSSNVFVFVFVLQVKTQSQDAVLFYNTGPSSNKDFVALEISKGKPRLLVDQVRCVFNRILSKTCF